MAGNIDVTQGSGKTVATDDVGGAQFQRIKIDGGSGGNSVPVIAGRQADAASMPVALSSENVAVLSNVTGTVMGNIAHDGVDSGNPVKIGGRARSSEITPVSNNDRSDFLTDLAGKLIILPYANPENFVNGSFPTGTNGMTGTTSTSILGAAGGSLRNYITSVIISNSHPSTSTDVILQDGSDGTLLGTFPAAAGYGGVAIPLPVPIKGSANTAIFAKNLSAGANVKVTVIGYKGV